MKQAGRKPPETFDSPSHTEAEPSGPAEAAGSGEPYFELERDDDLRAIAAADEERDPAEDESPRLREKSRTLQRRQEREYAQRGIKETAASRAKRKLTEMQATAKSGQYSSSHSKTKRRLLKQYKDVLRDAQLPQITKNKLQGSFDEALRTPRTDRLGDPQSKYVAGSPELPFHDLPAGEASYAQPDYSKRKPQPEGGAQRVHANLKSDSLQDLTVAQARAKAKAHTDQAVRNAHHLPEGERIIIDYADTPSPEAREAMRQQFFRPNSPIEEVRFGNSVIRRSDPLSAGGKSSGTGVGGASRPAPMATPKKNPSPVSSRSTGRKTPAPNKKTRVKTPKIKPQAPVRKKPTPGASKSKGERIKDDAPVPVDPASSRGDRVTEALDEPDTVLGAARDYQQYKTEGRSEAEALSRSATTLAANLAGGPAGNVVNTGNPDQLLPAAKQIIKDKWNKLWS